MVGRIFQNQPAHPVAGVLGIFVVGTVAAVAAVAGVVVADAEVVGTEEGAVVDADRGEQRRQPLSPAGQQVEGDGLAVGEGM